MKRLLSILTLLLLFGTINAQLIAPAPATKAVVYFARPSALGALINFKYYDGEQLIARFNGTKYFRYECSPGKHVFWAKSENRSFVEADLAAGGIYLIEAVAEMGGLKARVRLLPVNSSENSISRGVQKLITKRNAVTFTEEDIEKWSEQGNNAKDRGLDRYNKLKADGKAIAVLEPTMMISPEDLKWEKKRKKRKQ